MLEVDEDAQHMNVPVQRQIRHIKAKVSISLVKHACIIQFPKMERPSRYTRWISGLNSTEPSRLCLEVWVVSSHFQRTNLPDPVRSEAQAAGHTGGDFALAAR